MSGMLVLNLGLIILFAVIFVFFYIKDSESQGRLLRYEKSLDDLHKELYKLQKILKNIEQETPQDVEKRLRSEFRETIDNIYAIIEKDREYVDNKLAIIENKMKEPFHFGNNIDDKRIIAMFRDGWSTESIAKELMLSKSEVEFTLKLAQIH